MTLCLACYRSGSRLTAAEQQHIANFEAQVAQLQHSVQSLTHPHDSDTQDALDAARNDGQQQQMSAEESAIADILTIARSPVFDSVYSRQARRSLADHLVDGFNDDEEQAGQSHLVGYATEEEEMRVASAVFDELRCAVSYTSVSEQTSQDTDPLPADLNLNAVF